MSGERVPTTPLGKYPGRIEHTKYTIEANGKVSYEFEIKMKDGDIRVEVDAAASAIVKSSQEIFQTGRMPQRACCRDCGMQYPVLLIRKYGRGSGKGAK